MEKLAVPAGLDQQALFLQLSYYQCYSYYHYYYFSYCYCYLLLLDVISIFNVIMAIISVMRIHSLRGVLLLTLDHIASTQNPFSFVSRL